MQKRDEEKKEFLKKMKNKDYKQIYKMILNKTCSLEEIYRESKKTIEEINNILLMMELDGLIEKVAGGYRCI